MKKNIPHLIVINAFDIETFVDTDTNKYIPFCICYNIKKDNHYFYYKLDQNLVKNSLDDIFKKIKKNIVFYVHYIQFDGLIILEYISNDKNYIVDILINDGSIYYLSIIKNNKKITFKCSYKIIPSKLYDIALNFKIGEKMIFPHKFSSLTNLNYIGPVPDKKYFEKDDDYYFFIKNFLVFNFKEYCIKYCFNDILITSKLIQNINNLISEFNLNLDKIYSAPSLSMKIFIKHFNNNKVSINNKKSFDSYIRPSYYGGRCEVYGNPIKDEFIFHYDFSGMYAQCMKQKFCYGKYYYSENKNIEKPGFYWIHAYSDNFYIPILPHHNQKNNKLMFTNGYIKGCYWFEEIQEFLNRGGKIIEINSCILFEHYDYIFTDFIDYFTNIRSISSSHKIFGKLMINSLYGRFGMGEKDTYSIIVNYEDIDKYSDLEMISLKKINDKVMLTFEIDNKLKKELNIKNRKTKNNISIASSITSKSRLKLYKAQESVIENHGRVLYSDTDSIFASYSKNVLDEKHGEILWDSSKKDTLIKDAVFISPKTYALLYENGEEIIKIKGFNQKNINFNEIKDSFYNNKDKIKIKSQRILKKKEMILYENIIDKTLNFQNYDKRFFIENYSKTIPLKTNDCISYNI